MDTPWQRLQQAFVEDHRAMIRGYQTLLQLIEQREFARVAAEAKQLDAIAGPHIEFEEKYLNARIVRSRGSMYAQRLNDGHEDVREAIMELMLLQVGDQPGDKQVERWTSILVRGIDHASDCASLLSELSPLSGQQQLEFLDGLTRLREKGTHWSDLVSREKSP